MKQQEHDEGPHMSSVNTRLPIGVRVELERRAGEERRSLSSQIRVYIEQGLERDSLLTLPD